MEEAIIQYINGVADEKGTKVDMDEDLFANGVLDSFGFLMLLSFLQDSFAIEFEEEDMKPENFMSIRSIVEFCERRR